MKRRSFLAALAASATVSACGPVPVRHGPPPYAPGPPSYYYDYYYYPDVSVYFHLYSGHYWYRDRGAWINTRILPPHIHLDHRVRRPIVIRDPRPYARWHRHREEFRQPRGYRRDRRHDRGERRHNLERHEAYRRRR